MNDLRKQFSEVVIDTNDKKKLIQYILREYMRTSKPVLLNVEVIREVTGKKGI